MINELIEIEETLCSRFSCMRMGCAREKSIITTVDMKQCSSLNYCIFQTMRKACVPANEVLFDFVEEEMNRHLKGPVGSWYPGI